MSARRVQRKHFKVQELPEELRAAIDEQITRGVHYRDIAEYISQMGHEIGKSSVARYGKDFLTRLERIRVVRDQARAIVEADPDAPATEMAEAASLIGQQLIMETLLKLDNADGEKVSDLLQALARLEASGVKREALKLQFNKGIEAAVNRIKAGLKDELAKFGKGPEIEQRLIAMVDKQAESLRK